MTRTSMHSLVPLNGQIFLYKTGGRKLAARVTKTKAMAYHNFALNKCRVQ